MLIEVKGKDKNEWKDLNLLWCDICNHPLEERNIRFRVDRVGMQSCIGSYDGDVIVGGTICRFCPDCYTMQETPSQTLHLSKKDLSDLATRIIIEKEKRQ